MLRPIIRHMDEEHCLAWFGNIQIILSREPPSGAFMRKIVEGLADLSSNVRTGTGALLVIRSDVQPPTEEARDYIKTELARSSMRAAAQVVEGTGFRGAAMRAVLTTLQMLARPPYPMKVFDRAEPASHWLVDELRRAVGDAPMGSDLAREVNTLRQRFLHGGAPGDGNPSTLT